VAHASRDHPARAEKQQRPHLPLYTQNPADFAGLADLLEMVAV
jgi:hypothetical protein